MTSKRNSDSVPTRAAAVQMLKTALVERKMTQAELADAAECHEKTVQNLMGGRTVRDQTLFDVAMVLGLDYARLKELWFGAMPVAQPMELKGEGGLVAPVYMGAYTRAAVDQYIGSYLTLRPSFTKPGVVVAYRTDVVWDPEWPSLLFEERERPDQPFSHRGRLYIPSSSMFIHLVSLTKGAMRMVVVSQLDTQGEMRGLITTLNKQGRFFVPVSAPIVYMLRVDFKDTPLGEIGPGSAAHEVYTQILDQTVADGYAKLVSP
ncbi:MAG: helix-turn-helix transcriptional regulator [Hyphomicrobium sp.]|nr:helix-turn-helix transcriptional regulator [Hyphomicrobium sp.]